VEELNDALLRAAVERRVLRSRRLRVDTTVMEADVRYPTDSGLCAHAVSRLTRAVRRVQEAGLAAGTRCRDQARLAEHRPSGATKPPAKRPCKSTTGTAAAGRRRWMKLARTTNSTRPAAYQTHSCGAP
jgi:transposase, IS5 family